MTNDLHSELAKIADVPPPTSSHVFSGVIKRSLIFPTTSLPLFGAVCSGLISILFGGVGFFTNAALVGLGFAGLSFAYNFFMRRPHHASRSIKSYYDVKTLEQRRTLATLQRTFLRYDAKGTERDQREQAAKQVRIVIEKFAAIQQILGSRFLKTELTYQRYLNAAKQVYLLIVDNLIRVRELLVSVDAIDMAYASSRLGTLAKKTRTDAEEEEWRALSERKSIWEEQWSQISNLLSRNEQALTSFSKTAAALNALDTSTSSRASFSADAIMADLAELAERAKRMQNEVNKPVVG